MSFLCTIYKPLKETQWSQNSHTLYLQRWDVIVWDELKARHVGAKTFITTGVRRAGDGCHSAAPEVSL